MKMAYVNKSKYENELNEPCILIELIRNIKSKIDITYSDLACQKLLSL